MNAPTAPQPIDTAGATHRIRDAQRIILTTHTRADGDAIGSVAGLQRTLSRQGKTVHAFLHEPLPPRYRFITTGQTADQPALQTWNLNTASDLLANADLLIIVDTCAASQLGNVIDPIRKATLPKMAIDHHLTRDPIVNELLLDENAGACCQILTNLCDRANWPIDAQAASLFYMGLATDTGWFRFSNATAAVFATAQRLINAGAVPCNLYENLYQQDPEPRLRLIGAVLSSFELHAQGRLAVIRITRNMLQKCKATRQMTEDIINEPLRIASVIACLLLAEPQDGGPIRLSFRSRHQIDVAAIAIQFGGGGHARAAGARVHGSLQEVYDQVMPTMIQAIKSIPSDPEQTSPCTPH